MDKRGVIGQGITSFPILFLILVIMVVFVGVSIGITSVKGHSNGEGEFAGGGGNLMTQRILFREGTIEKERSVFDFLVNFYRDRDKNIELKAYRVSFERFVFGKPNNCLFIDLNLLFESNYDENGMPDSFLLCSDSNGERRESLSRSEINEATIRAYKDNINSIYFYNNGNKVFISYYLGERLHE